MENDFEIIHRIGLSALLLRTISSGSWELLAVHKEADCVWFVLAVYPSLKCLGGQWAEWVSPTLVLLCGVGLACACVCQPHSLLVPVS